MSIFSKTFFSRRSFTNKNNVHPRKQSLRMETLEDRTLLAVTVADFSGAYDTDSGEETAAYVVDTLIDEFDADPYDGTGLSLREAIALAHDTPGTITFAENLSGTIELNEAFGAISITSDIDINVPDLNQNEITIDALGNSRIFTITTYGKTEAITVSMSNLNLTGGYAQGNTGTITSGAGGAISSYGDVTLNLDGMNFESNRADHGGAIFATSGTTLNISSSFFGQNKALGSSGGAISTNTATINVESSSFSENTAFDCGGAVSVGYGTSFTADSLTSFSGNEANQGGALFVGPNSVLILNGSTVSNNSAIVRGGGIQIISGGSAELYGVDIQNNKAAQGAGICVLGPSMEAVLTIGSLDVENSEEAKMSYVSGNHIIDAKPSSLGTGIVGDGNGAGIYLGAGVKADISDTVISDNQGFAASSYGGGLFSSFNAEVIMNMVVFSNNSALHGGGVYQFGGTYDMINVDFEFNSATQGGGYYQYLGTARFTGGTFENNFGVAGGGLHLHTSANTTLVAVQFIGNNNPNLINVISETSGYGGGIHAYNSNLVLNSVLFNNNHAAAGAGFYQNGGTSTVIGGTFRDNYANLGACLYQQQGTSDFMHVEFAYNEAKSSGGAVLLIDNAVFKVSHSVFVGNTAGYAGGAVYQHGGTATFAGANYLINNYAKHFGGSLYTTASATTTITGAHFAAPNPSKSTSYGAGIYQNGGTLTIADSAFNQMGDRVGSSIYANNTFETKVYTDVLFDGVAASSALLGTDIVESIGNVTFPEAVDAALEDLDDII